MLFSIALLLLGGMFAGWLCRKLRLPALLGMILVGVLAGPAVLDLIDGSILGISSQLRKIALIIILSRAGLTLNLEDLKKNGRPAVLMCFVPAAFEITGMILLAPVLLPVTRLEAAVMGSVVAAVSPAVIVPKMIKLMEEGYGVRKGIPQIILAGASVDDVFVIVLFSAFTSLAQGKEISVISFVNIPVSILLGAVIGMVLGYALASYFQRVGVRDAVKLLVFLSVSFLLTAAEDGLHTGITFSGLIAVMFMGIGLQRKKMDSAKMLSGKFNQMWVFAEVILFTLVGASVDISYVSSAGLAAVILIFAVLVFRMLGVCLCMAGTKLNWKERIFCMLAYMPKATVQAAIGGLPMAMGLPCGKIVLTVAVLAIFITAPLGAFLIDATYQKLLEG
ncbi:transporter CPA2 family [Roseburia sp. CAG:303]|nr:transporter CPA2 family [Roseburia sp. CAG:303]